MTTTHTPPAAGPKATPTAPEFYCAEVWGGNRPMDGPIQLPGVRGWMYSHPSEGGRGGDIHYVSLCNSGLTSRMCLADVAGHGESVARVSAEIHRLLRRHMNTLDQRKVLSGLNQRLERTELGTMTTAAAITYFPPARSVSVSYAGHPPGWFYAKTEDRWSRLKAVPRDPSAGVLTDLPLGTVAQTSFSRRKQRVTEGDRVLLVTDGVLEAPGPRGELFGEARVEKLLDANRSTSLKELAHAVVSALIDHTGDRHLAHDDVTLLVLEFVAGPKGLGILHGLRRLLLPRPRRYRASD